jgi:hypothetical protein
VATVCLLPVFAMQVALLYLTLFLLLACRSGADPCWGTTRRGLYVPVVVERAQSGDDLAAAGEAPRTSMLNVNESRTCVARRVSGK